jgi:hypothetical protein
LDKLGTDSLPAASRPRGSTWEDLREVAKVGLIDPAQLRKLDRLLSLPSVRETAKADDALSRARAFALVLQELLDDLRRDASPERAKMIACIFMLEPAWKGTQITRRREHLALVDYGGDTSSFRRNKERPLYEEVAALLKERPGRPRSEPSLSAQEQAVAAIGNLLASIECVQQGVLKFLESNSRDRFVSRPWLLHKYAALLVSFEELRRLLVAEDFKLKGSYLMWFFTTMDGGSESNLPFGGQDVVVLRHAYLTAQPETRMFPEILGSINRGQNILEEWEKWLEKWLEGCPCSRAYFDDRCKLHKLLSRWNAYGISLSRNYDLEFEPLDLVNTLER